MLATGAVCSTPDPALTGGAADAGRRGQAIGNLCRVPGDASANVTLLDPQAAECESQICLRPAVDVTRALPDTESVCSAECRTDDDCKNAEQREARAGDLRCADGFTCGVATEVGRLCCKRLCICRDFVVVPDGGLPNPASCTPGNPAATCPNVAP